MTVITSSPPKWTVDTTLTTIRVVDDQRQTVAMIGEGFAQPPRVRADRIRFATLIARLPDYADRLAEARQAALDDHIQRTAFTVEVDENGAREVYSPCRDGCPICSVILPAIDAVLNAIQSTVGTVRL